MTDLELSFDTKPIVAWRVWNMRPFKHHGGTHEHRLSALSSGTVWPPRQRMEASCNTGAHDSPWADCACGLWALRTRAEAEGLARPPGRVFGEVALWGRVLEFDKGYRSKFAYPQRLFFFKDSNPMAIADLRRVYGCDIEVMAETRPYAGLVPSPGTHLVTGSLDVRFTSSWRASEAKP